MSDYIKRDELLKIRPFTCYMVLSVCQYDEYDEGFLDCADEAREAIKNLPAADVAEVKHGKWIKATVSSGRESWECSVCHRRARGKKKNLPYCHCGAKMDLED